MWLLTLFCLLIGLFIGFQIPILLPAVFVKYCPLVFWRTGLVFWRYTCLYGDTFEYDIYQWFITNPVSSSLLIWAIDWVWIYLQP